MKQRKQKKSIFVSMLIWYTQIFILCISVGVQHVSGQCTLCSYPNSKIQGDIIPSFQTVGLASPLSDLPLQDPQNISCELWNEYLESQNFPYDSSICLDMRDRLTRQCCEGLPPLYECETAIEELLLGSDSTYNTHRAPLVNNDPVDITIFAEVFGVEIANYGVDGGEIEVAASLSLSWVDERLRWNSTLSSVCPSVTFDWDTVWVPPLAVESDSSEPTDSIQIAPVKVFADGLVFWKRSAVVLLKCAEEQSFSKRCRINFIETQGDNRVNFIVSSEMGMTNGLMNTTEISTPEEYKINLTASKLSTNVAQNRFGPSAHTVFEVTLDPKGDDCNICGDGRSNVLMADGHIYKYPEEWLELYPDTVEWSCDMIDNFLTDMHVSNEACYIGRASFEEPCCDDVTSSYECESNIHDAIVELYNTVTPPDPSSQEDVELSVDDRVDVKVALDVAHVMGVDVKVNSMRLLVSLELSWYDLRLAFEPFLGGCHHVSYRASLDAELTEIWVPQIELINMIDGVNELPDVFASVRYDGLVSWRRTGVLEGSCELNGIDAFPYDVTSCFLEFGGTRDPLYDRVHYYFREEESISYSDRISDNEFDFQEYRLVTNRTRVFSSTETMSGFTRDVIKYEFHFARASGYYSQMFVVLYILFTYLAMGVFFVDYGMGERLGYGSSVLFVIVAQDITVLETTPVTDTLLWIYQLSLASKIISIFTIVQSICVVYIYTYKDFEEDEDVESSRLIPDGQPEEATPDDEQKDDPRESSGSTRLYGVGWTAKKILRSGISETDPKKTRKVKILRAVDLITAGVLVIVYSCFLIWLFSMK